MACSLTRSEVGFTAPTGAIVRVRVVARATALIGAEYNGAGLAVSGNGTTFKVVAGEARLFLTLAGPHDDVQIVEDGGGGESFEIYSYRGAFHPILIFRIVGGEDHTPQVGGEDHTRYLAKRPPKKRRSRGRPALPQPQGRAPRHAGTRYANAVLLAPNGGPLNRAVPIAPGQIFSLRLDLGWLSPESQVEQPRPFPDRDLPQDIWLGVMLASSHFAIGSHPRSLGESRVVHGRLFLPGDGGAATTSEGGQYLHFWLQAPASRQLAMARVGFYYRNALLQSLRLSADIGGQGKAFTLDIDYTMVGAPADLGLIPDRPRLSVITNENADGHHQVTVRSVSGETVGPSTSFELDERTIGMTIAKLRSTLRSDEVAPLSRRRSRERLIEDLRRIAPTGWDLHTALAGQFLDAWYAARKQPENLVVHVSRPTGGSFTLPWSFLYEIYLDSAIEAHRLRVCDLVDRWDGKAPLFTDLPRQCPLAGEPWHRENVLCPFGFWGYRYSLEQLSSTDRPVTDIAPGTDPLIAVGRTEYEVDKRALDDHIRSLTAALTTEIPRARLQQASTKQEIRELLGRDLALVYFYCHGERLNNTDPNTFLGVGLNERITPGDFIGWVQRWRESDKVVWGPIRPLIFVNACHSLEINPDTLVTYLDAFVGAGRAAGVIGTEVKVAQTLAMELATEFFRLFSRPGYSVDRALREVRLGFLADGNLLGLVYTPYCWADLHLSAERSPPPTGAS